MNQPTHKGNQVKQNEDGALKCPTNKGLCCEEKEFLEAPKAKLFLQKSQEFLQQTSWPVLMSSKGTVKGSVGVRELSYLP